MFSATGTQTPPGDATGSPRGVLASASTLAASPPVESVRREGEASADPESASSREEKADAALSGAPDSTSTLRGPA
jgi:hypothetical protein